MKILHVVPSFHPAHSYGGPIRSTLELCTGLVELGGTVRVLTTDADGLDRVLDVEKNEEVLFREGFRVRYCPRRQRHSVSPALMRLLPAYIRWADVVHLTAVYNFPTFPTVLWARKLKKPLIWSPRGALQRWDGSSRIAPKAIWDFLWYHAADRASLTIHATSEQEARDTSARFPKLRIAMIPNGVTVPADLSRLGKTEELRMLFIGRLDPKKGIEALLKACNLVGSAFPWRLSIVGWGTSEYVSYLKERINALGISGKIKILGPVLSEIKKALFEVSDVVLVPSYSENFGMVVAEALAHEVPVIASTGTPWSRLKEMNCGLWVDNDPESLANAIHSIRAMPLQQMGRRGREWMQNEFSWRSVTSQMLALYQQSASANVQIRSVGRNVRVKE